MMPRKPPRRLEDAAFAAWLTALDAGACVPSSAPPPMLSRALRSGSRLREATIIRVVAAAAAAGVYNLHVEGEFLNQALLQQLAGSLTNKPDRLEKLTLDLSPRIMDGPAISMLANALKHTSHLQELRLTGGACDEMLFAVAKASPPLVHLDLAYSNLVTDAGIKALLGMSRTKRNPNVKPTSEPMIDLKYLNLWGTKVTTRGCLLALKHCTNLSSLTCCWTSEALVLLEMQESNPVSLEQLLISEEELNGSLFQAIVNLCPCLKVLTVRRPKDYVIDIATLILSLPNLKDLSAVQFCPPNPAVLEVPYSATLNTLHLSPLSAPTIYLDIILTTCPMLRRLILEGVTPALKNASLLSSKEDNQAGISARMSLKELKIMTAPISNPLDPSVIMWFVSLMQELDRLHLGCCKLFRDEHILDILQKSCLKQVNEICLSGAMNLSNSLIYSLAQGCPLLKRLALRMLPKERLLQLESLKVDFRMSNLDLELITYSHRF